MDHRQTDNVIVQIVPALYMQPPHAALFCGDCFEAKPPRRLTEALGIVERDYSGKSLPTRNSESAINVSFGSSDWSYRRPGAAGIQNSAHLSHLFSRVYGCAPDRIMSSEYRQSSIGD